jgi:hypothetical protein
MLHSKFSRPVSLSVKPFIWGQRLDFCFCQAVSGLLMWDALSDDRTGLLSTIASGLRQLVILGPSPVGINHILLSQIRHSPKLWGPGPRIFIPQDQGGPIIHPGIGFPFHRPLRLAGIRWKYLNGPPSRDLCVVIKCDPFIVQEVLGRSNRLLSFDTRTNRIRRVQQFFYCFTCIRCSCNVFIESLPSRGRGYKFSHTDWWEGFMKYVVKIGSSAMIYADSMVTA